MLSIEEMSEERYGYIQISRALEKLKEEPIDGTKLEYNHT